MAISKRLLNDGESVVFSTRTHAKALLLPALVLIVLAALAGYLTSLTDNHVLLIILWAVVGVLLLWWVVWPFLNWMTSTYTVTTRRLITRHGVLTRTGHDIPLNRISDVSSERGVLDRMLGCGTLVISDASEQGRVALHDIPQVEKAQLLVSELLFSNRTPGDH